MFEIYIYLMSELMFHSISMKGFQNHLGMIFFCDTVPDIFDISQHRGEILFILREINEYFLDLTFLINLDCELFKPVPTNFGICQSFNTLSVDEIYKNNPTMDVWSRVFDEESKPFNLTYPKGYGSSKGLYIMLNAFETHGFWRKNQDFILSVTNEDNYYDIIRNSYTLEPGNFYTYKVMASQITTTQKFDAMSRDDRKCLLQSESDGIKYLSEFSRSGCEFECAMVRQFGQKCN